MMHLQIKSGISNAYMVSVMHHTGNLFKWPNQKDEILYLENIVAEIKPPTVVGHRGKYSLEFFN